MLKKILQNKQSRSSLITSVLSVLLMFSLLLATFQVTAWFKNHVIVHHPAGVTNFKNTVQYHDGTSWVTVAAGKGIPIQIVNGAVEPVSVRIEHQGKSAVAIRVSAFGNFYNADTGTVLPLSANDSWVLSSSSSNWGKRSNDYHLYYKDDYYSYNSKNSLDSYTSLRNTDTFTVTANVDNISLHQDYSGEFFIIVDAVQPDRFQEFWGISDLPFTLD